MLPHRALPQLPMPPLQAPVVDFQWNPHDPWTFFSVADEAGEGGGGTLQVRTPSAPGALLSVGPRAIRPATFMLLRGMPALCCCVITRWTSLPAPPPGSSCSCGGCLTWFTGQRTKCWLSWSLTGAHSLPGSVGHASSSCRLGTAAGGKEPWMRSAQGVLRRRARALTPPHPHPTSPSLPCLTSPVQGLHH